ncbi:PP2C family protein-serine/threonine phosphatase [Cryobacterium sp. PH31-AA6]|uniref:PP2C family protein-serine/threonine phosphatase n=1 Tax=Cryobacterium sp. PH31-AA6 TaxID=3046205 RepID=UPI0024B8BC2C|nr:PP2C family protein-serine/threonine phosphatase [Cryobacterium sp. PH31-AA6]MDJ0325477.1 PP2C family protein-serine/threonine phosphatase [Cryobacterium sp. PH31-AA6]
MFPAAVRHPDGYDLAGLSIPRMQIAGDLYTWRIGDRFIDMTLVDVMGQGTAAAILAAGVRSAFHARADEPPAEFVDAGHGLTVLIRADGSFQRLASRGLPLGISEGGGWLTQTVGLVPGDSLVSFTDGVLDLYDGTLHSLTQATDLVGASASTDEFFSAVRLLAASGQATDDITVLVVTRT